MRRCREMPRLGGDDRRGEKGPCAYVPPMDPWSRIHESSGLLASVFTGASPAFLSVLFSRFCSSQRDAEVAELSSQTRNHRWLAVSLGSDAETSSTEPVSGWPKSSS